MSCFISYGIIHIIVQEEILSIDPFVIYEEQYMNVRDLVSTAINDTEKTYMEELEACIRVSAYFRYCQRKLCLL